MLSPVAALQHEGERVVVQFVVRGGDMHPDGHAELFSETTWRNKNNLIVRFLKAELPKFNLQGRALIESYRGKTVRVHGSVQMNPVQIGDLPLIEVGDPGQIEVVR